MNYHTCDSLIFEGFEYTLVKQEGSDLFSPKKHGLSPFSYTFGRSEGFYCKYELKNNLLILKTLFVGLKEIEIQQIKDNRDYQILGVKPEIIRHMVQEIIDVDKLEFGPEKEVDSRECKCENISLNIGFTGELWIGTDFEDELYLHTNFKSPWKYKKVIKLVFDNGTLKQTEDISDKMKDYKLEVEASSKRRRFKVTIIFIILFIINLILVKKVYEKLSM